MTQSRAARLRVGAADPRIGFFLALLLVWLAFEFGRPPNPLSIPLLISLASFVGWFFRPKVWTPQAKLMLILLAVVAAGVPFAVNNFSAYSAAREMAILFFCICLPLQSLLTTVHRLRAWVFTLFAVVLYVGSWAATHGGYGPSGADGGQDENYVAAMMGMAIPFAYFSFFVEKRPVLRMAFGASILVFVAAVALGVNPSRGGFLGLIAVAAYCLYRSPRKILGFAVLAAVGGVFALIAGPAFWAEIGTSTDYEGGTGGMRVELWKAGLRMFASYPLTGVGAGNFAWRIGDFQTAEQFEIFGRSLAASAIAHSSHVEMLAELGLPGTILTMMLVWRTWADLGKVRNQASTALGAAGTDPELVSIRVYADAVRASILAILVNGIFLSLFYYSHLWLLLSVGSALPFLLRNRLRTWAAEKGPRPMPAWPSAPAPAAKGHIVRPGGRGARTPGRQA